MHRLRVMIDGRMLLGRFSGISRFVTRLVDELVATGDVDVVALCGEEVHEPWAGRNDLEVITSTFGRTDRTACRRLFWEQLHLPRLLRRAGVDLFHATWNTPVPRSCPVPCVLTIHDLIPWYDPDSHFATARQRWSYRYSTRSSVRKASMITTVSQHVRRRILSLMCVDPGRVVAIPNGVDLPSSPGAMPERRNSECPTANSERALPVSSTEVAIRHSPGPIRYFESPTPPRYVLYVGGHEPRKNLAAVFAALHRYWQRFEDPLDLRLTGHAGSLSPDAAETYRRLSDPSRVRFLGDVDDKELTRQYRGAQLLLMLSHDEGFGLPALEAMAHGCPVIAAARASLPEVVGNAGILVDPDNANEVSDAVRGLVTSPSRRAELARLSQRRAGMFRWDATASRMLEVYRQAAAPGATNKRCVKK